MNVRECFVNFGEVRLSMACYTRGKYGEVWSATSCMYEVQRCPRAPFSVKRVMHHTLPLRGEY